MQKKSPKNAIRTQKRIKSALFPALFRVLATEYIIYGQFVCFSTCNCPRYSKPQIARTTRIVQALFVGHPLIRAIRAIRGL